MDPFKSGESQDLTIKRDDLMGSEIAQFLADHIADMHSSSPPESVHALDLDALRHPSIKFFSAWQNGQLVGSGALKQLTPHHAELKSMRTLPAARGQGVAQRVLTHLMNQARELGYTQLSLETGTPKVFEPAQRLYAKNGFKVCEPFADYKLDPFSVYMTLMLQPRD
jgi:putative acetyltransferase